MSRFAVLVRDAVRGALSMLAGDYVWRVRHGFFSGLLVRGGLGWLRPYPSGLTAEQRFLSAFDFKDMVVYDIGAADGRLAWFFSQKARQVFAFEPNPVNFQELVRTVQMNACVNIEAVPLALGSQPTVGTLVASPGLDGTGSLDRRVRPVEPGHRQTVFEVQIDTLDGFAGLHEPPDFVKIDTEGFELDVLEGASVTIASFRPRILVEIHGATRADKLRNASDVVGWLTRRGYSLLHVETNSRVAADNVGVAAEGHLYGTPG